MSLEAERELVERQVRARLRSRFPDVDVYDVELRGRGALAVFIQRPGGVDLDLCAAVSSELDELRARYALEVSSPGLERTLRRPDHFRGAVGERVLLRLSTPREGRATYRGILREAGGDELALALDEGDSLVARYDEVTKATVLFVSER
jgi:ribosome maturation factor RimP